MRLLTQAKVGCWGVQQTDRGIERHHHSKLLTCAQDLLVSCGPAEPVARGHVARVDI
jgi:hypothetical protein